MGYMAQPYTDNNAIIIDSGSWVNANIQSQSTQHGIHLDLFQLKAMLVDSNAKVNANIQIQSAQYGIQLVWFQKSEVGFQNINIVQPHFIFSGYQPLGFQDYNEMIDIFRRRQETRHLPIVIFVQDNSPPDQLDSCRFCLLKAPFPLGRNAHLVSTLDRLALKYLMEREKEKERNIVGAGRFKYDRKRQEALVDGVPEPRIRGLRFKLYSTFIDHQGEYISKEDLNRLVYPTETFINGVDNQRLEALVKELRRIIESGKQNDYRILRTRNGGYIFEIVF
jgi:DNA-binding response OmpR family regulator